MMNDDGHDTIFFINDHGTLGYEVCDELRAAEGKKNVDNSSTAKKQASTATTATTTTTTQTSCTTYNVQ
jgi:sensor domain CHASE-containing protein